ncbi:MAG: tail fiber protein [Gemmataceae bacterium]|nr:tail fiber protein [Gemmataceae bacterium]
MPNELEGKLNETLKTVNGLADQATGIAATVAKLDEKVTGFGVKATETVATVAKLYEKVNGLDRLLFRIGAIGVAVGIGFGIVLAFFGRTLNELPKTARDEAAKTATEIAKIVAKEEAEKVVKLEFFEKAKQQINSFVATAEQQSIQVKNAAEGAAKTEIKLEAMENAWRVKIGESVPIGSVIAFAGVWTKQDEEKGWIVCDGRKLDDEQYAKLKSVLQKESAPDFRGRVLVAAGNGPELKARKLGDTGGSETHTLTIAQMPSHSHEVNDPGHKHIYPGDARQIYASGGDRQAASFFNHEDQKGKDRTATTGITIKATGGGQAFNIMQPYYVTNFIIKYR